MSVQTAHNIVMQLGLSPKERKELAKLLAGNPGKPATRHEEFKEDFKERLRRIAERKNLCN